MDGCCLFCMPLCSVRYVWVCVNPQGFKSCSIRFQAFLPPGAKWLNDTSCSCFNTEFPFPFFSLALTYFILLFSRPYCNVNSTNTDLITQVKRSDQTSLYIAQKSIQANTVDPILSWFPNQKKEEFWIRQHFVYYLFTYDLKDEKSKKSNPQCVQISIVPNFFSR